jgi:hypothetical protein
MAEAVLLRFFNASRLPETPEMSEGYYRFAALADV